MSKIAKKLSKFRQNPKNVRYDELESLLLHLGFIKRQSAGSHVVFTYPGEHPITVPITKPFLKPTYVRNVIRVIDDLGLMDEN